MHWAGLRPVYVMRRRVIISPTPSLSSRCTQCSPQSFPSHWLQFSLLSLSLRKKSNNRFSFFFLSLPLVLALGGHHGQLQLTRSDRRTVVSVVLISLAIITSPSSFLRSHALASLHAPLLSNDGHSIPPDPPSEGREDSVGETSAAQIESRINYSASTINCDTTLLWSSPWRVFDKWRDGRWMYVDWWRDCESVEDAGWVIRGVGRFFGVRISLG